LSPAAICNYGVSSAASMICGCQYKN